MDDLQIFPSRDSSFVALQGRLDCAPLNVRVQREAIDDFDRFSGGAPTESQRIAFVRHNLEVIAEIAQAKIDRSEFEHENWHGRDARAVRITGADFAEYLGQAVNRLSFAAFDPGVQPTWGRDGRF